MATAKGAGKAKLCIQARGATLRAATANPRTLRLCVKEAILKGKCFDAELSVIGLQEARFPVAMRTQSEFYLMLSSVATPIGKYGRAF